MTQTKQLQGQIRSEHAGWRLDRALAALFPQYSRARLQGWLAEGLIQVDSGLNRAKDRVAGGEQVRLTAQSSPVVASEPEPIPLEILYEDEAILVLNKPPGLVVHPGAGNRAGTLQNALLHHAPQLVHLPRAGIVHRLDKHTSGLLVIAKTFEAHTTLVAAIQARAVTREYDAIVNGVVTSGGNVEAAIGRHPVHRTRMAVREGGRSAVTHFRVKERFRAHSWLRVQLETGRTHQIRVHMTHLNYPLVGDPQYSGRPRLPPNADDQLIACLQGFRRQALHACTLALQHPVTNESQSWQAPIPSDMRALIEALRSDIKRFTDER